MFTIAQKPTLNDLYDEYVKDPLRVDEFATELRDFVTKIVKRECRRSNAATYDTIEDAIGETLLKVWSCLKGFDSSKSLFTTYVTASVLNNIVDIFRKYNKRQEIEFVDDMPGKGMFKSIENRLEAQGLLSKLDEEDKSFVKLKLAGYSEQQLADAFGKNPKWAKNKWFRLAERLRLLAANDV